MMRRLLLLFLTVVCGGSSFAQTIREAPELQRAFASAGFDGSILIYDSGRGEYFGYNVVRVRQSFLPASTFKIVNSLIALETGVAPDENLVIPWDKTKREIEAWNQDHTMASAFKVSCVPYYQEIARRVGRERMQSLIDKIGYGNRDLSGPIDQFWLTGSLRVTSVEQITLLRALNERTLPLSRRSVDLVKQIMLHEETPAYRIYGKTGLGRMADRYVGWWVGWVEREGRTFYFATNLDAKGGDDRIVPARINVTKAVLESVGALR